MYSNASLPLRCYDCHYAVTFGGTRKKHCDYIGFTGKMRGASVAACDKFTPKNKGKEGEHS
jgi:hypothetical protein